MLTVIPDRHEKGNTVAKISSGDKTIHFRAKAAARFVNPPEGVGFVTVYIHGDAENAAGFDIPVYKKGVFNLSKAEQPVLLEVPAGYAIECRLVLWRPNKTELDVKATMAVDWAEEIFVTKPDDRLWGLIVAVSDKQALKYAQACQRRKKGNP